MTNGIFISGFFFSMGLASFFSDTIIVDCFVSGLISTTEVWDTTLIFLTGVFLASVFALEVVLALLTDFFVADEDVLVLVLVLVLTFAFSETAVLGLVALLAAFLVNVFLVALVSFLAAVFFVVLAVFALAFGFGLALTFVDFFLDVTDVLFLFLESFLAIPICKNYYRCNTIYPVSQRLY
ncbi:MAG: hypothetical protein NZ529_03670 [Cytophagaceae bacterium]|nr:hypothetical protein [Cytophagaceae bacterium]MDW8455869.1 hypothetical protein [Cytophagaceae bacterium]